MSKALYRELTGVGAAGNVIVPSRKWRQGDLIVAMNSDGGESHTLSFANQSETFVLVANETALVVYTEAKWKRIAVIPAE